MQTNHSLAGMTVCPRL